MFYELLEYAQLMAIGAAIVPSAESIYRLKCREFCIKFHTPLDRVMELDPMFVLQNLYEDEYHPSIVAEELPELLEKLNKIKDPNYTRMSKEDMEDLVDAVLNKENKRLGKIPSKATVAPKTPAQEIKKNPPKSGGLSFESLNKSDELSEGNRGGFKD